MLDIPATSLESCSDGRNPTCSSPRASSCWWRHRCHWSYWWASLVFMLPAPRLEVQCCVWHVTMRLDFRFQTCFPGMKSVTVTVIIRPWQHQYKACEKGSLGCPASPSFLGSRLSPDTVFSTALKSWWPIAQKKIRKWNGWIGFNFSRSMHCFYPFQK